MILSAGQRNQIRFTKPQNDTDLFEVLLVKDPLLQSHDGVEREAASPCEIVFGNPQSATRFPDRVAPRILQAHQLFHLIIWHSSEFAVLG